MNGSFINLGVNNVIDGNVSSSFSRIDISGGLLISGNLNLTQNSELSLNVSTIDAPLEVLGCIDFAKSTVITVNVSDTENRFEIPLMIGSYCSGSNPIPQVLANYNGSRCLFATSFNITRSGPVTHFSLNSIKSSCSSTQTSSPTSISTPAPAPGTAMDTILTQSLNQIVFIVNGNLIALNETSAIRNSALNISQNFYLNSSFVTLENATIIVQGPSISDTHFNHHFTF
jgi:hypothetical protein